MVMDDYKIPRGRRSAVDAWAFWSRVELQPPNCYVAILVDVDRIPTGRKGKPLITPSWIVESTETGKYHAGYALQSPVHDNTDSLQGPLRKLAAVADRLTIYLGGDHGYGGTITRNPIAPGHAARAHWYSFQPFTLDYLAKRLPPDRRRRREPVTAIGRNVELFSCMIREAHAPRWARLMLAEGWSGEWLEHVCAENVRLWSPHELPYRECRHIAKSCAKYVSRQWSEAEFSKKQKRRIAKRWHDELDYDFEQRNASIWSLHRLGMKAREIAPVVQLSKSQVNRIIASGAYHNS